MAQEGTFGAFQGTSRINDTVLFFRFENIWNRKETEIKTLRISGHFKEKSKCHHVNILSSTCCLGIVKVSFYGPYRMEIFTHILLAWTIIFSTLHKSLPDWDTSLTSIFLQLFSMYSSDILISGSHVLKYHEFHEFSWNLYFLIFLKLSFALSQVSMSQNSSKSDFAFIIASRCCILKYHGYFMTYS